MMLVEVTCKCRLYPSGYFWRIFESLIFSVCNIRAEFISLFYVAPFQVGLSAVSFENTLSSESNNNENLKASICVL